VGFGFPLYSTPLIALFINIKLVVILTVIPNLIVTTFCILRDGKLSEELKKYWTMAIYVLLGTLVGSHALLYFNDNILKLILSLMIIAYLIQEWFKNLTFFKTISSYWITGPIVGLLAGFLAGSVNVSSIPLVIYFLSLDLTPFSMIQLLNLCFAVGKGAQFISLSLAGVMSSEPLWILALLSLVSAVGVLLGFYFYRDISIQSYRRLVNVVLSVIAVVLIFQVVQYEFSSLRS
jgi:uncharacterized membrane protein YfcA